MIDWHKGSPPKEPRKFLVSFGGHDIRVLENTWRHGEWVLWDGDRSYIAPRFWAEANFPEEFTQS